MISQQSKRPRLLVPLMMLSNRLTTIVENIRQSPVVSGTFPTTGGLVLGTHDGSFHCDEALALSCLKILPEFRDATILRTRDVNLLAQCNVVVDVGAVYNPETNRYDHHQREFTGTLDGYSTKLSSAGLVYKHFGYKILQELLKDDEGAPANTEFVDICYQKIYKGFFEHVDAIDNGIAVSDGPAKYHVSTTLSARVGMLNPDWNEVQTPDIINERFTEAMALTGSEFLSHVNALKKSWWPARSIVQKAIDSRLEVHESGKIILFDQACPWKDHLFEIEQKAQIEPVLYALYADQGGSWRIQAVPVDPNSFDSRKKLPVEWCGLRDDVLSEKTGIPGGIFIHASGFIGGHKTKEGALAMAIQALTL